MLNLAHISSLDTRLWSLYPEAMPQDSESPLEQEKLIAHS